MAVYVDEIRSYPDRAIGDRLKPFGVHWSHMMTDADLTELHLMADKIGLDRKWFQAKREYPHYDLTRQKRSLAVEFGAIPVTSVDLIEKCGKKRFQSSIGN